MREETKKPLWNLIQEMVFASFTGYRSLLMLAAILGKGEGYEAAKDHFTWYLMNSHQIPKDTTLGTQEIADMFETCVHEHLKQITYACVDAEYMLQGYGLARETDEPDRIGFYLNAMEEQHRSLDWKLQSFKFNPEQLKTEVVAEAGCTHFGFAEKVCMANPGLISGYNVIDKRPICNSRKARFSNKYDVELFLKEVDIEANPGMLINVTHPLLLTNILHCLRKPIMLLEYLLESSKSPVIVVVEQTPMATLSYAFDYHMKSHKQYGMLWPATFDKAAKDFPQWTYEISYPNNQYTAYRYTKR